MQQIAISNCMRNFKITIECLVLSGLILFNALLLNSVGLDMTYFSSVDAMFFSSVVLHLSRIALLCLLIAIISLVVELCKFINKCIKKFKEF